MHPSLSDAARTWVGTRFAHQGRRKQTAQDAGGVDCLGLLIGVAEECGLRFGGATALELDETDYGHYPNEARLMKALCHYMQRKKLDAFAVDNVVLMEIDGRTQHLGIIGLKKGRHTLIHAYAPARKVVEHRLDDTWRNRLKMAFALSSN